MKLMPFNFDKISSSQYFISNVAGFHDIISESDLYDLVLSGKIEDQKKCHKLEQGLFVSSDESERAASSAIASGLSKRIIQELSFNPIFMIVPTLRCDHTCNYCQVSRADLNSEGYDISEENIPKIMEAIRRLAGAPYKIEIQGGEPLVRFDLIEKIYDEADAVLGTNNFEIVITSSLSLLDSLIIEWAKDKSVNFSVSLDGSEFVHNANRIIGTSDSQQKALNGIKTIIRELGADRVSTVTTVTKELLKRPESLISVHEEVDIFDLFVRPISPYGFANKNYNAGYSASEYMEFYNDLFEIILEKNKEGVPFREYSACVHMSRILNPGFSSYADLKSPSGIIFNCILFNYDGKVYGSDETRMLQRIIKDVDFSLGSIDSIDLNSAVTKELVQQSFNAVHPGCADCAYEPFCGVDPCQNVSTQGEPVGHKAYSQFCSYHMNMFRYLTSMYYNDSTAKDMLARWCYA